MAHLRLRRESKLRAHPTVQRRFYREITSLLDRERLGGENIFGRRWTWCRSNLSELTVLLLLLGKPLCSELNIVLGGLIDIVRLGGDAAR